MHILTCLSVCLSVSLSHTHAHFSVSLSVSCYAAWVLPAQQQALSVYAPENPVDDAQPAHRPVIQTTMERTEAAEHFTVAEEVQSKDEDEQQQQQQGEQQQQQQSPVRRWTPTQDWVCAVMCRNVRQRNECLLT